MDEQQDMAGVQADDAPPDVVDLAPPDDEPPAVEEPPPVDDWNAPDDAPPPPGIEMDDAAPPPGEPTGEQGDAPPLPEGAGGDGSPFPDQPGLGQEAPAVTLGDDALPSAVDLAGGGDAEAEPPGQPTGELGDAPPLPMGAGGGGQSPMAPGQPGGDPAVSLDDPASAVGSADGAVAADAGDQDPTGAPLADEVTDDDSPRAHPGVDVSDTTTPPPVGTGGTGDLPEAPPVPDGAGGDQSPVPTMGGGGGIDETDETDDGTVRDDDGAKEDDGTGPMVMDPTGNGATPAGGVPGAVDHDSALELVNAFLPHEDAQAVLAPIAGDGGEITSDRLIDVLRDHGLQPVGPGEHGAAKLEDVMAQVDKVHLVGTIDGKAVPLIADRVDDNGHTIVCVDRMGHEYDVRAEDADRVWRTSGSPLLSAAPPVPMGHAPGGGVQMTSPPTSGLPGGTPPAPGAGGMPGIAGAAPTAPPVGLAAADTGDGGLSGGAVLAGSAAALIPIALGGGLLARRLTRKQQPVT